MRVALALSGGAARGIAHLGVIKALEESGFEIVALSGSSAGALVSVFYAHGYTPEEMLRLVRETSWVSLLRPGIPRRGLIRWDRARRLLGELLKVERIEDLGRKVFICTTDLLSASSVYFERGDLIPVLLGSCSLPGIFEPVRYGRYLLIDGGVMNNLPLEPLESLGVFRIGVDVNPIEPVEDVKGILRILVRSFFLAVRSNVEARRGMCDLLIVPDLKGISPLEVGRAEEIFRAGYEATLKALGEL
jgi:NTE family protein